MGTRIITCAVISSFICLGCAEVEPLSDVECIRSFEVQTCVPADEAAVDLESGRVIYDDGWFEIHSVEDSKDDRWAAEDEMLAELETIFPQGYEWYMGWGFVDGLSYSEYVVRDGTNGHLLVMIAAQQYERSEEDIRYVTFMSFWYDMDRSSHVEHAHSFAAATRIVDW